jgi:hypothetical protein|tara:strand:+ start:1069 stop:1593 length:525 start_codon:yes stop_codon:yes gene_type:complete
MNKEQDHIINKYIWNELKMTDPRFTTRVNKGFGDITTIDPMWQIMKMTELFGPVGHGWKWEANYNFTEKFVSVQVMIFWKDIMSKKDEYSYGPVCSIQKLYAKTGALRDEAPKIAMTDALTKGLSHLGLSADVFLGMHDSSKYVEKITQEINDSIVNKSKIKVVSDGKTKKNLG